MIVQLCMTQSDGNPRTEQNAPCCKAGQRRWGDRWVIGRTRPQLNAHRAAQWQPYASSPRIPVVWEIGQPSPWTPSGADWGQQAQARRYLDHECLTKHVRAYIFKLRSRTVLRRECASHTKHDAIRFRPCELIQTVLTATIKPQPKEAGTSKVQKVVVP